MLKDMFQSTNERKIYGILSRDRLSVMETNYVYRTLVRLLGQEKTDNIRADEETYKAFIEMWKLGRNYGIDHPDTLEQGRHLPRATKDEIREYNIKHYGETY